MEDIIINEIKLLVSEVIDYYKNIKNISDVDNRIKKLKKIDYNQNLKIKPNITPVNIYLDEIINSIPYNEKPEIINISKILKKLNKYIRWDVGYQNMNKDFNEKFSFGDIIGPNGIVSDQNITLGFVLIGPYLNYPAHKHPAVELYTIMSTKILWSINNKKFKEKYFLENVHHKEMELHEMETKEYPFLGIYTWIGDLNTPSSF